MHLDSCCSNHNESMWLLGTEATHFINISENEAQQKDPSDVGEEESGKRPQHGPHLSPHQTKLVKRKTRLMVKREH